MLYDSKIRQLDPALPGASSFGCLAGFAGLKLMIRRRLNYIGFYLRLITLLLPLAAFSIAAHIRFFSGLIPPASPNLDPGAYFQLLLLTTVIWAFAADHFGLCHLDQLFAAGGKTRRLLAAWAVTLAAITTFTFFYRQVSFSRLFVCISAAALLVLAGITRVGFRVWSDRQRVRGKKCIRVLIVGTEENAARAARSLLSGQVMPCSVVGFVRLPGQRVTVEGGPIFELDHISKLANGNGIDDVVIAVSPARLAEIPKIMTTLEPLCVPVRAILDFGDGISIRETLFDFGGVPMLDFHNTPAESVPYIFFKRAFDIVFSLFVIIVTAPLMALIAIAIRMSSPGPALFVQERVGLNGKIFRMYKFRTMRMGDPQESETRWTSPADPRRTKLGKFLRRTNLDELPQFFNVLKGDMSVVGPRPERPYFVEKFLHQITRYNARHYLKVGITGWAQVNGWRGDTSIEKRVEYDLYYLRNWSLTLDLQIILLTLMRGFWSRDAY